MLHKNVPFFELYFNYIQLVNKKIQSFEFIYLFCSLFLLVNFINCFQKKGRFFLAYSKIGIII